MSKFRRQLMMVNTPSVTPPEPPTPVLPYDAQVEWIRFDGRQYINTGIYPSSLNLVLEYKSKNNPLFGWVYQGNSNRTWIASGNRNVYWKNYNSKYAVANANDGNIHTWKYDMKKGFYEDGSQLVSFTAAIATTAISSIPLHFGRQYDLSSSSIDTSQLSDDRYMDVESLQVLQGSTLVRNYIPVRVGQVGYLYDQVSEQLFGNVGLSSFVFGNDVTT